MVMAGADAIGFVFYPPSPRLLSHAQAATLSALVPPFVSRVGLFVNEPEASVRATIDAVGLDLLQFHGEENEAYCRQFGLPYIKAARVRPEVDLLEFASTYPAARGLLLDAHVAEYGGVGKSFDWQQVPAGIPLPLILSGGLSADNVGEGIRRLRPWAVDVSSGVEVARGIKDAGKIKAFVAAVREADAKLEI